MSLKSQITRGRKLVLAVLSIAWLSGGAHAESLTIGTMVEPKSMDPQLTALSSDLSYYRHVFDSLVTPDDRLRPRPGLAESWKIISDTEYEFKLRRGVHFHDGSTFDAQDVVYTLKRLPNVPNSDGLTAGKLKLISQIEVKDPYTIRIHTARPDSGILRALGQLFILPSELGPNVSSDDFSSGKAAIGTGPFRFVSWKHGDNMQFTRNNDYWGNKSAFDKVTFRIISNAASRVAALQAGDVDMIDFVPPLDVPKLSRDPKISIFKASAARVILLELDTLRDHAPGVTDLSGKPLDRNPFKDLRVRKAITHAINRQVIVERVLENMGEAATQLMPAGFGGYNDSLKVPAYDPALSKKLLSEAGYSEGFGMTLGCTNGRYVNDASFCQAIGQMLARIGIKTKIDAMPGNVYFPKFNKAEFGAYILGWGNSSGDASSVLTSVVHSADKATGRGSWNHNYANPKLDALISKALGTVDDKRREELYAETMKIVMDDAAIIPLHAQLVIVATRKGLIYTPAADEATLAQNVKVGAK
jgi:peptide/nickel transport system substrate-binding protein